LHRVQRQGINNIYSDSSSSPASIDWSEDFISEIGDEALEINFEDNGIGIEKENLTKIFDPFFTTKPAGKGTGLGLAVCYGIIQRHFGTIDAYSTSNEKTIFTIILPVYKGIYKE